MGSYRVIKALIGAVTVRLTRTVTDSSNWPHIPSPFPISVRVRTEPN